MLNWFKRRPRPSPSAPADAAVPAVPCEAARRELEGALACYVEGRHQEAESLARSAIEFQHDYADAHLLLAQLCHKRRAYEEAEDSYVLAACFAPAHAEPRLQHGLLCLDRGDLGEAQELLQEALALDPHSARAHNAMGAVLIHLERPEEAKTCFERAIECDGSLADAHSNLGYVLFRDFEKFALGEAHIRKALELAPGDTNALVNLTMALRNRPRDVIELADRLLAQNATLDAVRLNRALAALKLGDFESGWRDYEARKSTRCNYVQRAMPWSEWDGGDLRRKGIYVHTEQGLGDEIMFASCLPQIVANAGRCVIECSPKLLKIFARSFAARVVVQPKDDASLAQAAGEGIDCYCALGSLPRFLRPTAAAFPEHPGYLRADPVRVEYWRARLGRLPGALKIGIAWRGGTPSTQRSLRSTRLDQWLPALRLPGMDFVDLQHFDSAEERQQLLVDHSVAVHRWSEAHDDYDETAALVAALDMVVSVQTAIVHLSGALGQEAWALIPEAPEWRYLSAGEHMPWYPSVRLFRKTEVKSWDDMLSEVAVQLRERAHRAR